MTPDRRHRQPGGTSSYGRAVTTTRRRTAGAPIALTVAFATALLLLLLPGSADTLRSGTAAAISALRALGHGTLAVNPGFAAAMVVTAVTALLPLVLAVASRASSPHAVLTRALLTTALVVVFAAASTVRATLPWGRFRDVVLAGLVGVALGALGDAFVQVRAHAARPSARTRRNVVWIAVGYGVLIVLVATWRTPVDSGIDRWLARALATVHRLGLPTWLDYSAVEFTANVLLFAPFGMFAALFLGARRWWIGMLGGFVTSCAIETVQALFLPARTASVDDVIANTAGAVLGVVVGVVILGRGHLRRDHR